MHCQNTAGNGKLTSPITGKKKLAQNLQTPEYTRPVCGAQTNPVGKNLQPIGFITAGRILQGEYRHNPWQKHLHQGS